MCISHGLLNLHEFPTSAGYLPIHFTHVVTPPDLNENLNFYSPSTTFKHNYPEASDHSILAGCLRTPFAPCIIPKDAYIDIS